MPRYAEHECDDCGVVLPSNQLHRIQDKVLSSVSKSTRLYRGTRGGLGGGGSSRATYKIQRMEVCPDCYQDRADRARRAAFWRMVGWVAAIGLIAVIVIAVANAPRPATTTLVQNQIEPANTATSDATSIPAAIKAPEDAPVIEKEAAPSPTPMEEVSTASIARPSRDEAVDRATQTALTSGTAEPWSNDGDHGFVSVSSPQDYPDRVCRNAYSTLNSRGEERRSDSVMWCQPKSGGDWMPAK